MSKPNRDRFIGVVLRSFGWPVFWGLAAAIGFYALLSKGVIHGTLVRRYTAGHPVEYVEVMMFFVGLAALVLRGKNIMQQLSWMNRIQLEPVPEEGQHPDECASLLKSLAELPQQVRQSYFVQRLQAALEHVFRKGSADQLEDELKYLSESDTARAYEGYALVRIIVWATPMLGFLGTVIGITLALGDLSPEALVNSPKEAMEGLLSGLSVAFDTTALALTLSIFLMFAMFLSSQVEAQLLAVVDRRASADLARRFQQLGSNRDPHLASIERMSRSVINSSQQLVERQIELWSDSMQAAQQQWNELIASTSGTIEEGLSGALQSAAETYASNLASAQQNANDRAVTYWEQVRRSVEENSRVMQSQQAELVKQGDVLLRVLDATAQITTLEQSLNENLRVLAGAKNFEDTVMSLSAAIHLLNSRLGNPQPRNTRVKLDESKPQERAA